MNEEEFSKKFDLLLDQALADLRGYKKASQPMSKTNIEADFPYTVKKIKKFIEENKEIANKVSKKRVFINLDYLIKEYEKHKLYLSTISNKSKYTDVCCIAFETKTTRGQKFKTYNYTNSKGLSGSFTDAQNYAGKKSDKYDYRIKLKKIRKAVKQAQKIVNSIPELCEGNVLKIFMAPEFYFRGRYGVYSYEAATEIITELMKSPDGESSGYSMYKDWIFVFGTVVCAAIIDEEKKEVTTDNMAITIINGNSYISAKENISSIDFIHTNMINIINDENLAGEVKIKYTPKGEHKQKRETFFVKNSVEKLKKNTDERLSGAIITHDGITIGIEICLDHDEKRVEKYKNIQILLIPSAGMYIQNLNAYGTSNGVIAFNVDGGDNPHSELQYKGTKPTINVVNNPIIKVLSYSVIPTMSDKDKDKIKIFGKIPIPQK